MSNDLVSRLLEAISETERLAQEIAAKAGLNWVAAPCGEHLCEGHLLSVLNSGKRPELVACQPCEGGGTYEPVAPHIAHHDPTSVLRHCGEDRALVEWYEGWQETFRGPIPEGHTKDGALHFRMASEFVFMRLLTAYGLTEEET